MDTLVYCKANLQTSVDASRRKISQEKGSHRPHNHAAKKSKVDRNLASTFSTLQPVLVTYQSVVENPDELKHNDELMNLKCRVKNYLVKKCRDSSKDKVFKILSNIDKLFEEFGEDYQFLQSMANFLTRMNREPNTKNEKHVAQLIFRDFPSVYRELRRMLVVASSRIG